MDCKWVCINYPKYTCCHECLKREVCQRPCTKDPKTCDGKIK